jgi:hypothetical protein
MEVNTSSERLPTAALGRQHAAWRELAFRRIADYEHASPGRRSRLLDRVQGTFDE